MMIKRLVPVAVKNRQSLRVMQRHFSINTDDKYKEDFEEKKEEKKEEPKSSSRFAGQYKKPAFLEDDYDHLKKGEGSATIENTGFDIGDDEFLPDYLFKMHQLIRGIQSVSTCHG